jgi:hypothetical protein
MIETRDVRRGRGGGVFRRGDGRIQFIVCMCLVLRGKGMVDSRLFGFTWTPYFGVWMRLGGGVCV